MWHLDFSSIFGPVRFKMESPCLCKNKISRKMLLFISICFFPSITFCTFSYLLHLYFFFFCRGQEQHIRYEHIYLTEPTGQSEVEYAEIKRPRLEMGPESVMRPSSHRPPLPLGGPEDMTKVSS